MKLLEVSSLSDEAILRTIESNPDREIIQKIYADLEQCWQEHGAEFQEKASGAKALIVADVDEFALANARTRYEYAAKLVNQLRQDDHKLLPLPLFEELKAYGGTIGSYIHHTKRKELAPLYESLTSLDQFDYPLEHPGVPSLIRQLQQKDIALVAWMTGRRPGMKYRTRENLRTHHHILDAPVMAFPKIDISGDIRQHYLYGWKVLGTKKFVEEFNLPTILIDDNVKQIVLQNMFNQIGIHGVLADRDPNLLEDEIDQIMSIYYP